MSYDEFIAEFMPLVEYFKAELSQGALGIYYRGLKELSVQEFRAAVDEIIKGEEFKFMPKVAQVLKVINGDLDQRAELALKELLDALKLHGTNVSVCFKDRAIMGVVDAVGGWVELGKLSGKEWEAFKTFEFKKRYPHWANNLNKCPLWLAGDSYQKNKFNNQSLANEVVGLVGFSDDDILWWQKHLRLDTGFKGVRARVDQFEPVIAKIAHIKNKQTLANKAIAQIANAKRISHDA